MESSEITIITSLSPSHSNKDNQSAAIKSWQAFGECVSMNHPKEIEKLKSIYNGAINFVETEKTFQFQDGKPLVNIYAMTEYATTDLLLVNSDIIIPSLPELKQDGITIMSRYDYSENMNENKIFPHGFDVFYIPKQFLKIFTPSIYSMGAAWWDFMVPYRAILNNIPVYYPHGKFAFHKLHPIQYSFEDWTYLGEYFREDFKMNKHKNVGQIATEAMSFIKANMK